MRLLCYCRRLRRWFLPGLALYFVLSALPGQRRLADRGAWSSRSTQRQFAEWSHALQSVGLGLSPTDVERLSWRAVQAYLSARDVLLRPLNSLNRQLGLGQSWALFSSPQTDPCRLVIEVETDGQWQTVYQSRSEVYVWQRALFDQHRIRKLVGRLGRSDNPRNWNALTAWISRRVWADWPKATTLRVSLVSWHTQTPSSTDAWIPLEERGSPRRSFVRSRQQDP